GLFPDDLGRQLLQITQHRNGKLAYLDLAFELRPESFQCDRVLGVVLGGTIDMDGRRGMVEYPPQIGRKGLVRLPVEAEPLGGAGLIDRKSTRLNSSHQ